MRITRFARDSRGGNPRGRRQWSTNGIGFGRRSVARSRERLRAWARNREAEVDAIGFSPQRSVLLQARVPFHLAFRIACRLSVALAHDVRSRRRRAAVAVSLVWDVGEAIRLRRDPRLQLVPRLLADVVDVAAWSAACGRAYSVVPVVGVPLITETALRY